jgi:hypothetical protein
VCRAIQGAIGRVKPFEFLSNHLQAVREQQKKANNAKKELRAAVRRLADITNQDDTAPKRGRKKRKVLAGGSEDETKEIKHLVHKFVITKMMWISDLARTVNTDVNDQYNPLERFENRGSKIQGELADLLDILPAKFHRDVMCSDWLIKLVRLLSHFGWIKRLFLM